MTATKKCPTGFNEMNPVHRTLMDLWEIADDYGTAPVSPEAWVARYRKNTSRVSAMRAWERFKVKIRQSPFPVEFVPAVVTCARPDRGGNTSPFISQTYEAEKALAIQLPRGARAELTKILDAHSGVTA